MTLRIESNEKAPSVSRSHLTEIRGQLEPRYEDVVIVVSELVTNSVRHSETSDIGLRIRAGPKTIRVEVSDDGTGFDSDTPRGDGLGLALVERIADRWGVGLDGRFTVWAELSRASPDGTAS